MKTVGIVAEYNPFHNGHAYQLQEARRITGADYCVVVMSGDFVQRGTPALMDKYMRTRAALENGADLVLELPVCYAVASAEYFASGAVALLDKLGVTDTLCFGSECGDIGLLSDFARELAAESPAFQTALRQRMKEGSTYPQARNHALSVAAPHLTASLGVLQSPNNILGIEYLKALMRRHSRIEPHTLSRAGAGYHTASLDASYSSAHAIRESISARGDILYVRGQVPPSAYNAMERAYGRSFPIFPDDLSALLPYKLFLEQRQGYLSYLDVDEAFSDRASRLLSSYTDYSSFCELLKTKNMTYTRVARNLLHILLNILREDVLAFCAEDYIYYARMLGFRRASEPLLRAVKEHAAIPLLSRTADAEELIESGNGLKMFETDIRASHIYALLVQQKFGGVLQNEYRRQLITV